MKQSHKTASCNAWLAKQYLPHHVKIGPHIYTVEIVEDLHDDAGNPCCGRTLFDQQKICLNPDHIVASSEFLDTFLHEVAHVANRIFRLGLDHEGVSRVAGVICTLLVDNLPLFPPSAVGGEDPEADPLFTSDDEWE